MKKKKTWNPTSFLYSELSEQTNNFMAQSSGKAEKGQVKSINLKLWSHICFLLYQPVDRETWYFLWFLSQYNWVYNIFVNNKKFKYLMYDINWKRWKSDIQPSEYNFIITKKFSTINCILSKRCSFTFQFSLFRRYHTLSCNFLIPYSLMIISILE